MLITKDITDDALDFLFFKMFRNSHRAAWIDMNRITSGLYQRIFSWAQQSDYKICSSKAGEHYVFDIDGQTFDQFCQNLGKKTKRNMRYYQRLLEREHGIVRFDFIKPNSEIENLTLLEDFLHLENSGWKGEQNSSILFKPSSRAYHHAMCSSANEENQMLWARCVVQDKTIAMMFVISRGDRLWVLKTAYDESYHRYSPGALLAFKLVEHSFTDPNISSISMVTHYDWIKRWKPESEPYYAIRIFPKSSILMKFLSYKNTEWKVINT